MLIISKWFRQGTIMSFLNPWRSNSGSKSTPSLPAQTPAEKQRSKQVQWMKNEVNGLIELQMNVLYQVQVNAGGQEFYILIQLPPGFPKDPPELNVSPRMIHSWIDDQGNIIGSPMLKNFTMHENLGKVVNQVIKEFVEHPPRPAPPPSMSYTDDTTMAQDVHRPVPPIPVTSHHHNASFQHNPAQNHRYTVSSFPEELPKIKEYSNEKLERFLNETEGIIEVEEYILKLPIIVKLREDRSKILEENESKARQNLSYEPQLEKAWDELQEKFLQLQTLRENFKKLHEEHRNHVKKYQRSRVKSMLTDSVQECEHRNEQMSDEFLRKKISVDNFLDDYLKERQLYYLRLGKQTRLKDHRH